VPGIEGPQSGGFFVFDQSEVTLSNILQSKTRNAIKVTSPPLGTRAEDAWAEPKDFPNASDGMFAREFRNLTTIPQISISPNAVVRDGIVTGVQSGRIRLVAPLIVNNRDQVGRLFSWLFLDLWFGELNWDLTSMGLAEGLATTDLITLHQIAESPLHTSAAPVSIRPTDATVALEAIIEEFEKLLDKPGVDEVTDIQPFLADPKRWFLLSPSCKQVWPQKMLGNKYKVDYVVLEANDTYLAVEIESPTKKVYKGGKQIEPYAEFTHAEQQVRDYCHYVDRNLDSVEREENLPGIFRPRGLVVIGRRRDLSLEGARKLRERNADHSRYTVIVYDVLIDQAREMVNRLRCLMS
jgi:hypothetical protein